MATVLKFSTASMRVHFRKPRLYAILNPSDSFHFPPVFRPHARTHTHTRRTAKLFPRPCDHLHPPPLFRIPTGAKRVSEGGRAFITYRRTHRLTGDEGSSCEGTNPFLRMRRRGKFSSSNPGNRCFRTNTPSSCGVVMQVHARFSDFCQALSGMFWEASVSVARGHLPLNARVSASWRRGFFFFFVSSSFIEAYSSKPTLPRKFPCPLSLRKVDKWY